MDFIDEEVLLKEIKRDNANTIQRTQKINSLANSYIKFSGMEEAFASVSKAIKASNEFIRPMQVMANRNAEIMRSITAASGTTAAIQSLNRTLAEIHISSRPIIDSIFLIQSALDGIKMPSFTLPATALSSIDWRKISIPEIDFPFVEIQSAVNTVLEQSNANISRHMVDIADDIAQNCIAEMECNESSTTGECWKGWSKQSVKYVVFVLLIPFIFNYLGDSVLSSLPCVTKDNGRYSIEVSEDEYLSAKYYDELGVCFVSKEIIMPRQKPDCSSRVTEKLEFGKIVRIIDKKKKWVKVRWESEGQYKEGWIQNYKLGRIN